MKIDRNEIARHYAAMADEELEAIDPSELTDAARECYERERQSRRFEAPLSGEAEGGLGTLEFEHESEEDSGWLEDAACAFSYTQHPGTAPAGEVERAREALKSAGIPVEVEIDQVDGDGGAKYTRIQLLVPGYLGLKADSVLDLKIYNPDTEANWRNHLSTLTDEQLEQLSPQVICAGMLDRAARLTRAFHEEAERRGLK